MFINKIVFIMALKIAYEGNSFESYHFKMMSHIEDEQCILEMYSTHTHTNTYHHHRLVMRDRKPYQNRHINLKHDTYESFSHFYNVCVVACIVYAIRYTIIHCIHFILLFFYWFERKFINKTISIIMKIYLRRKKKTNKSIWQHARPFTNENYKFSS